MQSNMISWTSFMFFVIGSAGGCVYLYEVISAGLNARRRNFNPVPKFTPLPLAGRPGRAVKVEPTEEPKVEDKKEVSDG